MAVQSVNAKAMEVSDTSQQSVSKVLSSTQKSDSEKTQSMEELESKTMHLTEISSKAEEFSKKPSKHGLETLEKDKSITCVEEKFDNEKFRDDKLNPIKHHIPTKSSMRITVHRDLPDFTREETASSFTKQNDPKPIAYNLSKRKVKTAEPLKTEKISYRGENNRLSQHQNSEMIKSIAEKIPMNKTCRLTPHWWNDQEAFVGNIIETTRYFQALNLSMNQTEQRFEIFEDENTVKILKPFNGQM
ncbi:hypothetical protein LOAG_05989 [Loa loa]|uniref:INCENP_ARK-bind domain-containing protein n=1 Tax=Loa loa TaxID=7209 RepID=A0A1I7W3T7_LOALO|nr:hypothetical protein LOAG_05989 [Loa loa]EFO22496.1 hypothetical protein LOAG_05989 [Loa loa]